MSLLLGLYYVLPMDLRDSAASTVLRLALGLVAFTGLMTWQLKAIVQSKNPGLRALEGLFLAVPLFLLLFASAYYVMGQVDESMFTAPLTRSDALYVSVTIFSTVGFGDITPQTEASRLVVSGQMMLDLIILGLGVRIILEAVQRGRTRVTSESDAVPTPS